MICNLLFLNLVLCRVEPRFPLFNCGWLVALFGTFQFGLFSWLLHVATSFNQVKVGKTGGNLPRNLAKTPRQAAWFVPMWETREWSLFTIKESLGCVFCFTNDETNSEPLIWICHSLIHLGKKHRLTTIFRMQLAKHPHLKGLPCHAALWLHIKLYCSTLQLRHEVKTVHTKATGGCPWNVQLFIELWPLKVALCSRHVRDKVPTQLPKW